MPNKTKWFCNIYFILFLMCGRPHIWKKTRIKRNFATAFYFFIFFILFHDRRPDGVKNANMQSDDTKNAGMENAGPEFDESSNPLYCTQ